MNNVIRNTAAALICGLTITHIQASVVSDALGINCDFAAGKPCTVNPPNPGPVIQRLPRIIQNLPQDVANLANPAGAALAFAIRQAKQQASFSARPMPAGVYRQLQPFFPADILQSVRYTTFDSARISLDSAVMLLNNDVAAITLEDVIVFRNESEAANVVTWAHELTHVLQYRSRGVETFANTYTTNAWVLENEAKDNAGRIFAALQGNPGPAAQQFAYFNVSGQFLYGDAYGNLYPADPATGRILGPANGHVLLQNGQYIALDSYGRRFVAVRVR